MQQPIQNHQVNQPMYINTNGTIQQGAAPIIMYQVQPHMYSQPQQQLHQQQQHHQPPQQQIIQQVAAAVPYQAPPQQLAPRQVQHKEAYIKYIANIRKQQHLHASVAQPAGDWYASLDVRPSRIRESRVMAPPSAWIENCESNDLLKHLISLRSYMLNDAVNIKKTSRCDNEQEHEEAEEVTPMDEESAEPVLLEL